MTKTLALLAVLAPAAVLAQDATLVAPTDARSPEEQRALFHLPPGFEIQLVASEPDIGQPMNLAFDAAGRLWVTNSLEYPYPAAGPGVEPRDANFAGPDKPHPPRDRVTVFGGIGRDGKPQTVTTFAEGLNIPIGLLPDPGDGKGAGAIVYGIPTVSRFVDADGDGKSDRSEPLLTGFGNVDTHGMVNGLRRWIDGWVYANHGFRNTSHVVGSDGSKIEMNSGNTFRFRPDGSHVEHLTHGQVNPFGQTFDPLGNRYNADCHSKPLTLLIRGAYYPSFGKPGDGLGFGPTMIDHSHGSTGICGPAYYAATQFPPDYRDGIFLCNPVTGRVHRDKLVWTGSTPKADTQPDFVTCDDGWFRPVDLTVGPDGALYMADFYNAIIGHYEVPLGHPKRDRSKGRVWRIVYVGENRDNLPTPPDLTGKTAEELAGLLGDGNLTTRVLASHALVDRHADEAVSALAGSLDGRSPPASAGGSADVSRAHAMWVLERLAALDAPTLNRLAHDDSRLVRTHAAQLVAGRPDWAAADRDTALRLLEDADPFVRRAAADALARHSEPAFVRPLLDLLAATPEGDTHLRYAARVALRDVLAGSKELAAAADAYSPADRRALAAVLPAVKSEAGALLLGQILKSELAAKQKAGPSAEWMTGFGHVVRYAGGPGSRDLIAAAREAFAGDLGVQAVLLETARTALTQRGDDPRPVLSEWGETVATALLSADGTTLAWSAAPFEGSAQPAETWSVQTRTGADGAPVVGWSSFPNGEQRTGLFRSEAFELPAAFGFWLSGHDGSPGTPRLGRNLVRLRDAATGAMLRQAAVPRRDVAQRVEWDLSDVAGRRGFVELQDGEDAAAYAWLAAGRFDLVGLNPSAAAGPARAADLIADLKLTALTPRLKQLLADPDAGEPSRAAAAEALIALDRNDLLASLVPLMNDPAAPASLKEQIAAATLARTPEAVAAAVAAAVKSLPSAAQGPIAERLAGSPAGAAELLKLVEQGHASPRLLVRPAVKERLLAHAGADFAARVGTLTEGLPAEDEALKSLIASREKSFDLAAADAEHGFALFRKNCAACHKIGPEGGLVGPQLDGIGIRGLARLTEDVLDPNRNVDGAFRASTLVLADGRVVTGLVRREEGASLILADNAGKEFAVPTADVEERAVSPLSIMPANFGELLPPEDYRDLLAYLLVQREPAK